MENAVETYGEVPVPIWIPDLINPSMDELIETLKFYDDSCKAENIQSRNKTQQKKHLLKSSATATAARSKLWSIYCGSAPICNTVNIPSFKQSFFPEKHPQDYSRLDALPKLLVCQYALHNQPDSSLKPYPFVFRLPTKLHGCNGSVLNKKIQRKLSSALDRTVLLWTTRENDGSRSCRIVTHINGEILINPDELPRVKKAFKEIFGSIKKPPKKPTQPADATITSKDALPYAIRFPMGSRNRQAAKYGKFYSIFNWASYTTKQELDRKRERFDCHIQKKQQPSDEKFHYISADLNKLAAEFYTANIKNKSPLTYLCN